MIVVINDVQQLLVSLQILAYLREHFRHFFYRTLLANSRGIGNDVLYIVLLLQNRYNIRNFALIRIIIKQNNCIVLWKNIGNRILCGKSVNGFRVALQVSCDKKEYDEQCRDNAAITVAETAQHRRKTFLMRFFRPFFLFGLFNQLMRQ